MSIPDHHTCDDYYLVTSRCTLVSKNVQTTSLALFGGIAILAVRNDTCQRRCPWSYFAQRRGDRGTEAEPTTTEKLLRSDRSDGSSADVDNTEDRVEEAPTVTEVPEADGFQGGTEVRSEKLSKSDRSDGTSGSADVYNLKDRAKEEPTLTEVLEKKVCGKDQGFEPLVLTCRTALSNNLFISDECDGKGVPELMRSSGRHMEEQPLIRFLKRQTDDVAASSPEQRLLSIQSRLADMLADVQTQFKTQFSDLAARVGNIELPRKLAGAAARSE